MFGDACKVPSPLPSSPETALEPPSATAIPTLPSPLKSPATTDTGPVPAEKSRRAGANETVWADAGAGITARRAPRKTNTTAGSTGHFMVYVPFVVFRPERLSPRAVTPGAEHLQQERPAHAGAAPGSARGPEDGRRRVRRERSREGSAW